MKNDRLFPLWHYSGAADESWCPQFYRELGAELAFRRARRAGRWRRLLGARRAPGSSCAPAPDRGAPRRLAAQRRAPAAPAAELPIERIVGVGDGGGYRPLPGLRAGHRAAWMRLYLADDPGGYPALKVHGGPGGYYLGGGDLRAVLILEVLRAKGASAVRVEQTAAVAAACSALPDFGVQEAACCA